MIDVTAQETGHFRHRDPEEPPAPDTLSWPRFWRETFGEPEMDAFRRSVCLDSNTSLRASVVDDLATYFEIDPASCPRLCRDWGIACQKEWDAAQTPIEFHQQTQSSSFSLLWYAYLQATGCNFPVSVAVARFAARDTARGAHLDFGSGVGVTSQLFAQLGYETTLADIARVTLDFARFRIGRRHQRAVFIDLNEQALPIAAYDVITAIDVLAHVPDFGVTVQMLYRALKPDGLLYANINVGEQTRSAPWHLYTDQRPLRRKLQTAGFEPVLCLDQNYGEIYRRVDDRGPLHALRAARDMVQFGPVRPLVTAALRAPRVLPGTIIKRS